jgi:hypothetical protein
LHVREILEMGSLMLHTNSSMKQEDAFTQWGRYGHQQQHAAQRVHSG